MLLAKVFLHVEKRILRTSCVQKLYFYFFIITFKLYLNDLVVT